MKLLKYALTSVIALTLSGCGDGGPSDSVVETKIIELVEQKIPASMRDSVELDVVRSECEPKEQEGVWLCIVSLKAKHEGKEETDTLSFNLKKANGEWFAQGPNALSYKKRLEFEGTN